MIGLEDRQALARDIEQAHRDGADDATDDAASLRAWKERYSQPWPHGVDPAFATQRAFGITSQSSVVVLDPTGVPVGTVARVPGPYSAT